MLSGVITYVVVFVLLLSVALWRRWRVRRHLRNNLRAAMKDARLATIVRRCQKIHALEEAQQLAEEEEVVRKWQIEAATAHYEREVLEPQRKLRRLLASKRNGRSFDGGREFHLDMSIGNIPCSSVS